MIRKILNLVLNYFNTLGFLANFLKDSLHHLPHFLKYIKAL